HVRPADSAGGRAPVRGLLVEAAGGAGDGRLRPARRTPRGGCGMTILETLEPVGEHDRRLAPSATGALRELNPPRAITPADVHIASTLARVTREKDSDAVLAAALANRAVRTGSVAGDAAALATTGRQSLPDLPWPDPETWTESVAGSRLASEGAVVVDRGLVY